MNGNFFFIIILIKIFPFNSKVFLNSGVTEIQLLKSVSLPSIIPIENKLLNFLQQNLHFNHKKEKLIQQDHIFKQQTLKQYAWCTILNSMMIVLNFYVQSIVHLYLYSIGDSIPLHVQVIH